MSFSDALFAIDRLEKLSDLGSTSIILQGDKLDEEDKLILPVQKNDVKTILFALQNIRLISKQVENVMIDLCSEEVENEEIGDNRVRLKRSLEALLSYLNEEISEKNSNIIDLLTIHYVELEKISLALTTKKQK